MIFIGADHRGFTLKQKLSQHLKDEGFEITDLGNDHLDSSDDYVDFAQKVAQAVTNLPDNRGILLCGSGVGVDITANKMAGIRSALVFNAPLAKQSREHENANIVSLPADFLDEKSAWEIVKTFLTASFSGAERHIRRLEKLQDLEKSPEELPANISRVAIFGGSHVLEESAEFKTVVLVSKKLAEAGFVVIDGGGPGVMKAATIGAKQGGGKVIGVTLYPDDMPGFEGRDKSNLVDEEIKTHSYVERTLILMREGQVFVIFKGGTGTISEFGMAWGLAKLYFGHHKPLILYGQEWQEIIGTFKKNMLLRAEELEVYKIVDSPQEVIQAIKDFEVELARGEHPSIKASINHRQG